MRILFEVDDDACSITISLAMSSLQPANIPDLVVYS